MSFLDNPLIHDLLIFLSAIGVFGIALVDLAVHVSYYAEIAKAVRIADREKHIDELKRTRLVLSLICLVCGYSLFSLLIHSPAGK